MLRYGPCKQSIDVIDYYEFARAWSAPPRRLKFLARLFQLMKFASHEEYSPEMLLSDAVSSLIGAIAPLLLEKQALSSAAHLPPAFGGY